MMAETQVPSPADSRQPHSAIVIGQEASGAEEMKSRRASYEARHAPPSLRRVSIFHAGVYRYECSCKQHWHCAAAHILG